MMHGRIWKVALLNWVMLAAAANSNLSQPNWQIAGNYSSAADCVAAIGEKLAAGSVAGGIASWTSRELGAVSGTGAGASPSVTPLVCLPANHPWVASVGNADSSGQGQEQRPGVPPTQ
ncbi:MAG: hypothetical protein ACREQ4_09840 [Candidatus Binataceae bacterium]